MFSDFFTPSERPPGPDCVQNMGAPKSLMIILQRFYPAEEDYPADACPPYKYHTAKIDNWEITTAMTGALTTMNIPSAVITCTDVNASGTVTASAFSAQSKAFNIPHPTRENRRLVHGCLEGPEYGVYTRGR